MDTINLKMYKTKSQVLYTCEDSRRGQDTHKYVHHSQFLFHLWNLYMHMCVYMNKPDMYIAWKRIYYYIHMNSIIYNMSINQTLTHEGCYRSIQGFLNNSSFIHKL